MKLHCEEKLTKELKDALSKMLVKFPGERTRTLIDVGGAA